MKNPALLNALNVAVESLENEEVVDQLIADFSNEDPAPSPSDVAHDIEIVDKDVEIIQGVVSDVTSQAEAGQEVSLEAAASVVNAIIHRYGGAVDVASMESGSAGVPEFVGEMNRITAALESAAVASLESYSIKDIWDKLGMLGREIPDLEANIRELKKISDGSVSYRHGSTGAWTGILQAFTVDGTWTSPSKAAAETGKVLESLASLGSLAIDNAKKAGEIAAKVEWSDEGKRKAGLSQINAIKNPANELVGKVASMHVMDNRKMQVKRISVKVPEGMDNWSESANIDVSWMRGHKGAVLEAVLTGGNAIYITYGSLKKHPVKVAELISGLEAILKSAKKVHELRSATAKKWSAHKEAVAELKEKVNGQGSSGVVRAISEADRMGWSAIHTAFTIIAGIIRNVNSACERIIEKDKKGE